MKLAAILAVLAACGGSNRTGGQGDDQRLGHARERGRGRAGRLQQGVGRARKAVAGACKRAKSPRSVARMSSNTTKFDLTLWPRVHILGEQPRHADTTDLL